MGTFILYSGDDGQSHIETIDLDQTPYWKSAQAATTISFSEAPAGRFSDWHTAPPVCHSLVRPTGNRAGRRLQARLQPLVTISKRGSVKARYSRESGNPLDLAFAARILGRTPRF